MNLYQRLKTLKKLFLRDKEGFALAILNIEDIWKPDLSFEANSIFATIRFKASRSELFVN